PALPLPFPTSADPPRLHPFPTRRSSDLSPATGKGQIFVPGGEMVALRPGMDGAEPQVVWRSNKLRAGGYASPVYYQDRVYAFNSDRKSTRLNSSHLGISYAVFCLKKKQGHLPRRSSIEPESRAQHLLNSVNYLFMLQYIAVPTRGAPLFYGSYQPLRILPHALHCV